AAGTLISYRGASWIGVTPQGAPSNVATHQTLRGILASGSPSQEYVINGNNSNSFSSHHAGGALFVFVDGSTQFLSETTDQIMLNRVAARNDGEVLSLEL